MRSIRPWSSNVPAGVVMATGSVVLDGSVGAIAAILSEGQLEMRRVAAVHFLEPGGLHVITNRLGCLLRLQAKQLGIVAALAIECLGLGVDGLIACLGQLRGVHIGQANRPAMPLPQRGHQPVQHVMAERASLSGLKPKPRLFQGRQIKHIGCKKLPGTLPESIELMSGKNVPPLGAETVIEPLKKR